jgi:hypothetical protein
VKLKGNDLPTHGIILFDETADVFDHVDISIVSYMNAQEREIASFGFDVRIETREKVVESPVQSAFLKANT